MKNIVCVALLFLSASACAMESSAKAMEKKQQELNEALGIAAQTGNLEDTIRLIEEGADPIVPSSSPHGITPLFNASAFGHLEVATYLVGLGALINELDQTYGLSPFHIACKEGHLAVVKFLANNGADIHARDKKGNDAWELANCFLKNDVAQFIYKFDEEEHNKKKQESKKS